MKKDLSDPVINIIIHHTFIGFKKRRLNTNIAHLLVAVFKRFKIKTADDAIDLIRYLNRYTNLVYGKKVF